MADYAAQRFNMVEAQVRTNDVTDPRIHAAMAAVARERFVPAARRAMAYADVPVEVSPGRFLLDPRTFAKLLQLAAVRPGDRVLDVACGTGYSTVVLAQLAGSVAGLEQDADLVRVASDMVPASGAVNASVVQGGLTEGVKALAPFDVIFINGAVDAVPEQLLAQLAEGGRLVAVLDRGGQGRAHLFLREKGRIGSRADFDATVPLLGGFRKVVGFVF
ncbi:MAG TPA: protein-L-isoaspartate O-methyltransferase [Rhizomicrobium sp.]|jgi:protein-L-isoaspartate(D-aspartate) O-methyltransferase|nr:protein-L-isoaspartate O-methyltransferase [Rhizomicrobium sp.]